MKYDHLHIAVCIPTHGSWEPEFGASLAALALNFGQQPLANVTTQKITFIHSYGSLLLNVRMALVRNARRVRATHILWLDSDMKFPPDTLRRLIAHSKSFVVAQGVTKSVPAEPTAKDMEGEPVYSNHPATGLVRIGTCGLAVALLQTAALEAMTSPLFQHEWYPEEDACGGEDAFFCAKFREQTERDVWLDHDLSREIGHIGRFTYTHAIVGEVRKERA